MAEQRIEGCGSDDESWLTRTLRYASAALRLLRMLVRLISGTIPVGA